MLHQLRKLAVNCITALAVVIPVATVAAAPAQAEYNGKYFSGCTYSWGAACYQPYQHVEYTWAMDPDNAYFKTGSGALATNNGYPRPKVDGQERYVCDSLWANPNVTISYGWVCGAGRTIIYPHEWGYPGLGSGTPYYNIALYQLTNWG